MTALVYTVPIVASWQRLRVSGRRHYVATEVRAAMDVHAAAALAVRPAGWSLDSRCAIAVAYTPASRRAHDTDRVLSLVLDALTGVLWRDDSDRYVAQASCAIGDGAPGTTTVYVDRVGDAIPTLAEERAAKRARRARRAA